MSTPGPLLGAHVSAAGGHHKVFARAASLGCEAIQLFTRAPGRWKAKAIEQKQAERFRQERQAHGHPPVIAHDIYLSNLAAEDDTIRQKSIESTIEEVQRCHLLGLDGLVCHLGAHHQEEIGLKRYAEALAIILDQTEATPANILLETCAGQGTTLGHRLEHLAFVLGQNNRHPRLGVCLDTCHVFAAGYDLTSQEAYQHFWQTFEREIGLEKLQALHLNDSKKPLASRVDRHDHIGQGEIGELPFRLLVQDQRLAGLPMVIETPEMESMHQVNLELLKSWR